MTAAPPIAAHGGAAFSDPLPTRSFFVFQLFARVVSAVSLVGGTVAILRGNSESERWDDLLFAAALATAAAVVVISAKGRLPKSVDFAAAVVALAGLSVGIGSIERPGLAQTFWDGFGVSVLLGSAVLMIISRRFLRVVHRHPLVGRLLFVALALLAVADLASLVRTSGYTADPVNNLYALNELLAAGARRVPDANFVPQYDTLYGFLLKPFAGHLGATGMADAALALLSVFAVAAVVIGGLIARRAAIRTWRNTAGLIVVPVACGTVLHGTALQGSIASVVQELPIRVFPGMLYFLLGSGTLLAVRTGKRRDARMTLLGIGAGLVAWNSQDFGIAAVVSFGCVALVICVTVRELRGFVCWMLGLLVGLAVYPTAAALSGAPLSLRYIAFFERTFGSGFGAASIQTPGPVLLVLPVVLATAAIGWRFLLCSPDGQGEATDQSDGYAGVTAAFFGTWSTLGFTYYLNRSFASGQLQVLLLPMAVGLVAVASLAMSSRAQSPATVSPGVAWLPRLVEAPLVLAVALLGASILQSPNPVLTAQHLIHPPTGQGFLSPSLNGALNDVLLTQAYARSAGGQVSYFGEGANYVTLALGVPSALLFNDPYDVADSSATAGLMCSYLVAHGTEWLVISQRAYFAFANACGVYEPFSLPGTVPGLVERRT